MLVVFMVACGVNGDGGVWWLNGVMFCGGYNL